MENEYNMLASMAVFSHLYNNNADVYEIIRMFIKSYITETSCYAFNLTEFRAKINEYYSFSIPETVYKSALKGLNGNIEHNKNDYKVTDFDGLKTERINIEKEKKTNDIIFKDLVRYIESQTNEKISDENIGALTNDFIKFLMSKSVSGKYSQYIPGFIIAKESDTEFQKQLNNIKLGIILYSGITTDIDISKWGNFPDVLNVYLDTEILFHVAGLNGSYYEEQAKDFLQLVRIINSRRNVIKLYYFMKTKEEIDNFYSTAENIVSGKQILYDTAAMKYIVNGCSQPSDVVTRKSEFYAKLESHCIKPFEHGSFYENTNYHKYCIQSSDFEANDFLNYVNCLRKGRNNEKLVKIKHIFMTGKSAVIEQAWNEKVKQPNSIPLATTLDYLTERFWLYSNKGFGNKTYMKSFDVIYKAKAALSGILSKEIKIKFDELLKKYEANELTEETVSLAIIELRGHSKLPEEIAPDEIDSIYSVISEDLITRVKQEAEFTKVKLDETQAFSREQAETIKKQETKINDAQKELKLLRNELDRQSKENEKLRRTEAENEMRIKDFSAKEARKQKKKRIWIKGISYALLVFGVVLMIYRNAILGKDEKLWKIIMGVGSLCSIWSVADTVARRFKEKKLRSKRGE